MLGFHVSIYRCDRCDPVRVIIISVSELQVRGLERQGGGVPELKPADHRQAGGVPAEPQREELHLEEVQVAAARVRVGAGVVLPISVVSTNSLHVHRLCDMPRIKAAAASVIAS